MSTYRIIELALMECSALATSIGHGANDLFAALRGADAEILTVSRDKVLAKPDQAVDREGNIVLPYGIQHDELVNDIYGDRKKKKGTGSFGYIQSGRQFTVTQNTEGQPLGEVLNLTNGQLAFAKLLWPVLRPKYGWIDQMGENTPGMKSIAKTELRRLFWANFFGKEYVEKFGREFLLNAPGWKKEELEHGGMLYIVTPSYLEWRNNPPNDSIDYFRRLVPDLRAFQSKGSKIPAEIQRMTLTEEGSKEVKVVYERKSGRSKKRRPKQ